MCPSLMILVSNQLVILHGWNFIFWFFLAKHSFLTWMVDGNYCSPPPQKSGGGGQCIWWRIKPIFFINSDNRKFRKTILYSSHAGFYNFFFIEQMCVNKHILYRHSEVQWLCTCIYYKVNLNLKLANKQNKESRFYLTEKGEIKMLLLPLSMWQEKTKHSTINETFKYFLLIRHSMKYF